MKKILILLVTLIVVSCSTQNDIDVKDYPIITTVSELSDSYDLKTDKSGKYETTSITNYFDGSFDLEYTYDLLESKEYDPLYYSITIEKENTLKDAMQVYSIGKGAIKIAGNSFEQGSVEIDSLQLPGDDSYYALRTYGGEPNGMFYTVRKGTRIYTPDHSLIKELLIPKITNLEEFEIIKK